MTSESFAPMSVAVVALVGGPRLQACVDALAPQAAELLILAPSGLDIVCAKNTRLIAVNSSVPDKRRIAFQEAKHSIVGFIEDTCTPSSDWCASMCAPFSDDRIVLACGPIAISSDLPPRYRALAITEYARFQSNLLLKNMNALGKTNALIGANFAVRKSAFGGDHAEDFIDGALFARLSAAGDAVVVRAGEVCYAGLDHNGARLSTRYHHGRIFGGSLAAGRSLLSRCTLAAKGIAAPLIQFVRTCRDAPTWLWVSPVTMLWVLAMNLAWGAGEVVGAATGSQGASLRRWR